ncbi:DEAD/DEAH box helicase [Leptospira ilyithenensis]|uniref:ATP-dependent helicase n=1 Tax=Leptospira ilyithenensis TaxID=2484901 RepID=A0A4R9LMS1_9LEPT|nr:DEAD/DEAH box helicase [Leptospira ilyithenensis]TGN09788.1 ATP-dependent helicase [Leptospira ilyithenensis]
MKGKLRLVAFLMPDGVFCEFAGMNDKNQIFSLASLYSIGLLQAANAFVTSQASFVSKLLYGNYDRKFRISDLFNYYIHSITPQIQVFTNDGRAAYFAGNSVSKLKLSKDEAGRYRIQRISHSFLSQTQSLSRYNEKYIWESPYVSSLPSHLTQDHLEKRIPVFWDGPSPDQRMILNYASPDGFITSSAIFELMDRLRTLEIEGLEILPECISQGPGLFIFLGPEYNEEIGDSLSLKGKVAIVYSKYKEDLIPTIDLNKKKAKRKKPILSETDTAEQLKQPREKVLADFPLKPVRYHRSNFFIEHSDRTVVRRNTKKERLLLKEEIPLKYIKATGEFRIPVKKVSSFFAETLPEILKRKFVLELHPDLDGLTSQKQASFQIKESSGVDWFYGELQIEGMDSDATKAYYAAWKAGRKFVKLQKNGIVNLSHLGFENIIKSLDSAGIHLDKNGKSSEFNRGQAIALDIESSLRSANSLRKLKRSLSESFESRSRISGFLPGEMFTGELRDYQKTGAEFLYNLYSLGTGGVLADEMGLGKTIQCLAFLSKVLEEKPKTKVIIVTPLAAIGVWEDECKRFLTNAVVKVWHGPSRKEKKIPKEGMILTTYHTFARDIPLFEKIQSQIMILDEAQYVKNHETNAARYLRKMKVKSVFCLTGTPMENHLDEFWALMDLSMPGLLGNLRSFQRNFFAGDLTSIRELQKRTEKFLLRRRKKDVLTDLPPRTDIRIPTPMGDRQKKLYESARKEAIAILQNAGSDYLFLLLPLLTRLRRIACHPDIGMEKLDPFQSEKINRLLSMVEEQMSPFSSALIFSQFTDSLSIVKMVFEKRKIEYFYLDGKTSAAKRQEYVKRFQRGERRFFLISLKAGGVALTLTKADTVFHLDPWWNPAVENQATDRAHRYGQTQAVFAYKLYSEGSIEERVLELQEKKQQLFSNLFDSESNLKHSNISREELLELIG